MASRSILIRFDADDGKVDIATAISVLTDIMAILDSSVSRVGLWESINSLAHSAEEPLYKHPMLEARIDSVNDGSVEMVVDLSTMGLLDPQAWFDTVMAFFNLLSPYLPEAGHEILVGALKGAAEVSAIGVGKAVIKRMRRFKDDKAETHTAKVEEDSREAGADASSKEQSKGLDEARVDQQTGVDEQLLNEFFLDSNMLNAVSHMVKTLDADRHGLNFTISSESKTTFSYLPLSNTAMPASKQDGLNTVEFTDMPAVITWKSDDATNNGVETVGVTKATVLYEGGEKKVTVEDAAFVGVDFNMEDLIPGTQLEVKLSGKSIYTPSKGTYHTKDLTIDEIVSKVN